MTTDQDEFLEFYRAAHTALHKLWSDAVGTPGYDKATWKKVSNAFDRFARDSATAAGIPRDRPLLP